jgi:hypothetical protein
MRQPGEPVEILTVALPNRDAKVLRQSQDFIDALAASFFVDKQFNRPTAAAQAFFDGVDPVEIVEVHITISATLML